MKISRALLSVSQKTGICEFAEFLHKRGIEIISTGGTARLLRKKGIPVVDVSDITHFPEMLDGRVKTLHPVIHGGILYVRGDDQHEKTISERNIGSIDLVVVNLYPFEEAVSQGKTKEEIIENIDIGGPTLLRSAAKNFVAVTVVFDPDDLKFVRSAIEQEGGTSFSLREQLAGKVFRKTSQYDAIIADYFLHKTSLKNTSSLCPCEEDHISLKYGENPHQGGEFFTSKPALYPSIATAKKLQGSPLGYCNILDADAALQLILEFEKPAVAIIKHATPCGVATGNTLEEAYRKALSCDRISAFGGIVSCNRPPSKELAEEMQKLFIEIIVAPEFPEKARNIFSKKKNLCLLEVGEMKKIPGLSQVRSVMGGFLRQTNDDIDLKASDITVATGDPGDNDLRDALFAWKVCKHIKSNAIVLVKDQKTIGIGGGQTSRVGASKIALEHAGEEAKGAVVASDAFFPFPDGVDVLAKSGVSTIIQPGGSKNDEYVFAAAKRFGVTMLLTGVRAFRH
jgi:phosphoribosylaminoimidazolecarboxamide formyltransferase/IMP cyclohydrolase